MSESVVSRVDESHDELRDLAIAAATAASPEEAKELARALGERVARHFDAEETAGGLFAWLARSAVPDRVVGRLQRQHDALRAELPTLFADLDREGQEPGLTLHRFVRHFLHHEWLERSAVIRAMRGPRQGPLTLPVCEEDLAMQDLATEIVREVERLGSTPEAVELEVPGTAEHGESQASRLEVCLGDAGIEFVEVRCVPGPALSVRSIRFEPPRA